MPDKRIHRGPHPEDAKLFTPQTLTMLRWAVEDMSWLLSRGYADTSALKLVGDRYELTKRQRTAVMRAACSDEKHRLRRQKYISPDNVTGQILMLDGYNILITIEAALGKGPLFLCRDGCIRDMASIHGTYRKVDETLPAIKTIAAVLTRIGPKEVIWLLDKPVSNSGRLKKLIMKYVEQNALPWQVELVPSPDRTLAESDNIIATSDSAVIDKCTQCLNLTRIIIETISPEYDLNLLDLR